MAVFPYLLLMKTTIDLPDALLHQAKIVAAQRKTTLKELMIAGLEAVLTPDQAAASDDDLVSALSQGHNTQPVGRLLREELYDRAVFRRH